MVSSCHQSLTLSRLFPFSFAENPHIDLFSTRPQPKKKRKSRTAFTNHQIFELEKRFLYQKYLSPADRDEIAAGLGLSNAQVIIDFVSRSKKISSVVA
jgi:homeobox protein LBX